MTVYTSSFAPLPAPAEVGVFDFLFTDNANIDPDAVALVDASNGHSLTYAALRRQSLQFADGFTHLARLAPGDTVLISAPNSLDFVVALFACQAAGLVCSTANPAYTAQELAHQMKVSGTRMVLTGAGGVGVVREACGVAGVEVGQEGVWVLGGEGVGGNRSWEELRGDEEFEPVRVEAGKLGETVAYLPFSSGTTGLAKSVAVTHANITSAVQSGVTNPLYAKDIVKVVIGCIPFYHIFGLTWVLHQTLYLGRKIVFLPKFDMATFLRAVEEHKVTFAPVVPPIALGLLKHPDLPKYDLSSIRFLASGAAPLGFELQEQLQARLAAQPRKAFGHRTLVVQGWGATEATGTGFIVDIKDGATKGLMIGKLMSGVEARLLLRGPIVMLGYHGNPDATAETFAPGGWMRTGDVAVRAADGNYTIVDRRKELIKYTGFQVPPAELEAVLLGCPLVADAAVIGVYDDDQATELPRAYIVPNPAHATDADPPAKVAAFVAAQVAPHKKLHGGVHLVDVVPKSPSGKILRKDLRALAAKEAAAARGKL